MLIEIYSEVFSQKKITFHNGLNVVLGDGSNSIGKSTLLMIIDFIFGGNSFWDHNKDAIQQLGEHEYNFTFLLGGEKYYFKRATDDKRHVFECDENYSICKTISIKEYTAFLKEAYLPGMEYLTFREFVGLFSRVWGKGNDEVTHHLRPLHHTHACKMADCIFLLIKIFKQFFTLNDLLEEKKDKELKLKSARKLFGTPFLPQIKINEYKKNQQHLKSIEDEITDIRENLATYAISIREVANQEIMDLKQEKDGLLRIRFDLSSKKKSLEQNLTGSKQFKSKGIAELQEIIPEIDEERLATVENFHNSISQLLGTEIKQSLDSITTELSDINFRISEIDEIVSTKFKNFESPVHLVDKIYDLSIDYQKCKNENDLFDNLNDLSSRVKDISGEIEQQITSILASIQRKINSQIYNLTKEIYGDGYKSPVLELKTNSYVYSNRDNTGTGAAYFSLLAFDISIFQLTELPFLIHDSRLYKNVEPYAIEGILPYYENKKKQTFIAIDGIEGLSSETVHLINNNKIIFLDRSQTLYTKTWHRK